MSANRLDAVLTQRFSSKQRQAGRGLGLESVIGLAETGLVGVEIQTAEGRGTRFAFRFVDEDAEDSSAVGDSPAARADPQRAKVFVVDDNELVASMLVQTLTASGFEAEYALSGEKALARETGSFDAVVTDFRMPGMDGHELAVRLKAAHPGLPIIIYSGQGGHIAHSALFSAVLSKPIKPAELVDAVRQSIANAL
jgi:CheY-like chemotaxis protein